MEGLEELREENRKKIVEDKAIEAMNAQTAFIKERRLKKKQYEKVAEDLNTEIQQEELSDKTEDMITEKDILSTTIGITSEKSSEDKLLSEDEGETLSARLNKETQPLEIIDVQDTVSVDNNINPVSLDNSKPNTIEEPQDNKFENEVAEKGVPVTMISMSNESSQRDESLQHNNSTEETQCLTDDVNESDEAKITKEAKLSDQQVAGDTDTNVDFQELDAIKKSRRS